MVVGENEGKLASERGVEVVADHERVAARRQAVEVDGDSERAVGVGTEKLGVGSSFLVRGVEQVHGSPVKLAALEKRFGSEDNALDGLPVVADGGQERGFDGGCILRGDGFGKWIGHGQQSFPVGGGEHALSGATCGRQFLRRTGEDQQESHSVTDPSKSMIHLENSLPANQKYGLLVL